MKVTLKTHKNKVIPTLEYQEKDENNNNITINRYPPKPTPKTDTIRCKNKKYYNKPKI
jgi:hypothetical protein